MTSTSTKRHRSPVSSMDAAWQLIARRVPHASVKALTGVSPAMLSSMGVVRNTLNTMYVPYHASVFTWAGAQAVASGLTSGA